MMGFGRLALLVAMLAPAMSAAPEMQPLPGFRDGPVPVLPPLPLPAPTKSADRRPFDVVGGLLVLGSIYLWSRSRRAPAARPPATEVPAVPTDRPRQP